ncbi:hypothetical protein D3C78_549210 [compost metagenome]
MTAIVYHQNQLIADRSHVNFTLPISMHEGPKIFISADKQFAYGATGDSILEENREKLEHQMRVVLEHAIGKGIDMIDLDKLCGINEIIYFGTGIFITRDHQFTIKNNARRLKRLDGATHGVGTGGTLLGSMLKCGMKLQDAMIKTNQVDHLTGKTADVIKASKLKPFIIKGTQL